MLFDLLSTFRHMPASLFQCVRIPTRLASSIDHTFAPRLGTCQIKSIIINKRVANFEMKKNNQ